MLMIYFLGVLLCLFSWAFIIQQGHILNLLIILEAMILSILVSYYFCSLILSMSGAMFLMMLTFAACEAAFGLSLLVSFLRLRGNDLIENMTSGNWFAKNSWNWNNSSSPDTS
uniref:NADH-ubiquinone oxidoreductase chain 4L n=1 Tax=Carychium tridentatum TaxID=145635 RepID=A0A1S5R322_9EUPU|nr:NADH dehydrogenase subunit 4L [Carychium tridentatum]ANC96336.1 NADH dehydrogenase subunit 4L [Carychium tridentatum]WIV81376.1 NADH dehydrogenase subunit 4l [Carychium tridentatum]